MTTSLLPTPDAPDAPQALLAATERLIYAGGIHATGMDAIVKASGVARKTIYRHFGTKDELVAAALRQRDVRWMDWFTARCRQAATPAGQLLAAFDALAEWFATPDFRGCAFINAAGETGDPASPVRLVARQHKQALHDFLQQLAFEHGAADANAWARQWLILIDGAISVALVSGQLSAAVDAQAIARTLLDQPLPSSHHTKETA